MKEKVIIFGLGINYYMNSYHLKKEYEIKALTDNNTEARIWAEQKLTDMNIISPEEIQSVEMDKIVITAMSPISIKQITYQLAEMGIAEEQIVICKPKDVTPFLVDPKFYETNLTYEEKKELFANNVEHITIEPNSKCNRKCWFCPNAILDRYSENHKMKVSTFQKIVRELEEIDYNGVISYSFYNEPLLDDKLEEKIAYVKAHLPKSVQLVTTNGDYLTKERLQTLAVAGLDDIIISIYNVNDPNFEWTPEKANEQVEYLVEKLELDVIYNSMDAQTVSVYATKFGINMRLQNHDFRESAHNRGETLPNDLPFKHINQRTKFCPNSFITLNVYYDGSVITCGNCRNDYELHKGFIMGNVEDDTIYDIFHSDVAREFRKGFTNDFNQYPCKSCTYEGDSFIPQYPNIPFRERPRYSRSIE